MQPLGPGRLEARGAVPGRVLLGLPEGPSSVPSTVVNKVGAEHPLPRGLCNLRCLAGGWGLVWISFSGFSLPRWFPRPGERAGRPGCGSLPAKTSTVIGHPLLFCTGLCCSLERVLRVRQLCGPSRSCPPRSQPRLSGGTLGTTADVGHWMAWSLNRIPLPPVLAREEGFTNVSLFTPISSPKAEARSLLVSCPHPPQPFYGGLRKALGPLAPGSLLGSTCEFRPQKIRFCKKCLTCPVVPAGARAQAVCQEQPRNWPRGSHM